jgi:hypothetical protein
MPLRQGGCEEWGSGWRRRFRKGEIRQDFDCRHKMVVRYISRIAYSYILHVRTIAQVRLAALFVGIFSHGLIPRVARFLRTIH